MRGGRRPGAGRPRGTTKPVPCPPMSDEPDLTPLEIIERAANRLYNAAVFYRSLANFRAEQELLRAAAIVADKATAYRHPKMPATIMAPNSLPPLRLMSMAQLEQLALELREGEYRDITDEENASTARNQAPRLEGPQVPPSNGSR